MTDKNKEDVQDQADLHHAGAIIRHSSPFSHLPSHKNKTALPTSFITEWVVPYYMVIAGYDKDWIPVIQNAKPTITRDICMQLLGDFNWRSRLVGCYFAAVKGYIDLIDVIGVHLLKSEVCCVGHIYALVLAFFNTSGSNQFLETYLDYYLHQPRLYFDQRYVMEALLYVDKVNGSHNAKKYTRSFLDLMCSWQRPEQLPATDYFDEQVPILIGLATV